MRMTKIEKEMDESRRLEIETGVIEYLAGSKDGWQNLGMICHSLSFKRVELEGVVENMVHRGQLTKSLDPIVGHRTLNVAPRYTRYQYRVAV